MPLARTLRHLKKAQSLIVTPRLDDWLTRVGEIRPDDDALDELVRIVRSPENQDRTGRFGASGRGTCLRAQIFTFLGMPGLKRVDPVLQNLFSDGTWRHYRWQMMLLLSGIVTHVEVPVSLPQYRLKCSIDALNDDEQWLFELKGISNFTATISEPKPEHLLQVHTYFFGTGWDVCSLVYEDKKTQEWKEFVIRPEPMLMRAVRRELQVLNEAVEEQELPDVLPECRAKTGAFKTCPYAAGCLSQRTWPRPRSVRDEGGTGRLLVMDWEPE